MIKIKEFRKKLLISLLVIGILSLFSYLFYINQDKINELDFGRRIINGNIKEYSLSEAKTYSCTLEKPTNRTVILRMDDIARWNNKDLVKNMINEINNRGYGVTLGIIPKGVENDAKLINWINSIKTNPNIELGQHGYEHSQDEFGNLSYEDSKIKLNLGKDILIKLFGEVPITFIPPYNVDSTGTIQAIKDSGFKIFSGNKNEYSTNNNLIMMGYTATTYFYVEDKSVPADEVLKECKQSIDKNGVCVIMFHPQDFTKNGKIDKQKYAEFVKVLDGLKDLNANVVNFRQAFCKEY